MLKAYKYRAYPNKKQIEYLNKVFGCTRFIWNQMLSNKENYYKNNKKIYYITPAKYKKEYPFLKEVDSLALSNVQLNLEKSFKSFFKKKSNKPKFKKKRDKQSFTTNNQNGTIYLEQNYLKIPKLKSLIKLKLHRTFEGNIKSATITKTKSNKYYISILVETSDIKQLDKNNSVIGIDMGLNEITLSTGKKIEVQKEMKKYNKKIKRLYKNLSKKKLNSANRNKARIKLSKLFDKINNKKYNFLHKLSTRLINENQVIVLEDLAINKMNRTKQSNINKAYNNLSWSMFKLMLEYKANWYGRTLIVAPKYYPSSQLCNVCGYKYTKVKNLNIKQWYCPQCDLYHDRDINAAINLKKLGQELSEVKPVEIGSVDDRSLVNLKSTLSMKQEALTSIS